MILRKIACAALFAFAVPVFAADEPAALPQKIEGGWGQTNKVAKVELIEMESPTKAKLKVAFWDGCTRQGETSAEFKEGAWKFIAPPGPKFCEPLTITMTKIPEKNRFEGTYETNFRGSIVNGKLYLEW
jgi:hypothetical protein